MADKHNLEPFLYYTTRVEIQSVSDSHKMEKPYSICIIYIRDIIFTLNDDDGANWRIAAQITSVRHSGLFIFLFE